MEINLKNLGMERGQQYETIITTKNNENISNAAPFGVFCKGKNEVMCRIFETSSTLKNILEKEEFIVNINNDPLMFTLATINTIPEEFLENIDTNLIYLKNTDAYFKCEVKQVKKAIKQEDPVNPTETFIINSEVTEIKFNNSCAKAINRGIHLLIESLVNYSRMELVDEKKQKNYLERLKEAERVIKKVGSKKEKESIKILKENIKKDFNI